MNKIYTMTIMENEKDQMNEVMKKHENEIDDFQVSKTFRVNGLVDVIFYIIVTNEETFTSIISEMNGTRMY